MRVKSSSPSAIHSRARRTRTRLRYWPMVMPVCSLKVRVRWCGETLAADATACRVFLTNRQDKKYILFRDSWGADYDNPQDWFDNVFICSKTAIGLGNNDGICDTRVDTAVAKGDPETGAQSISDYQTAGKQLVKDIAYANIEYGANQYFIKPYVQGGGGNALYDNLWTTISILQH
jgi:ABC-type oligopeptide transport system substrate-binding subunit